MVALDTLYGDVGCLIHALAFGFQREEAASAHLRAI